jgi:hypothetical protein
VVRVPPNRVDPFGSWEYNIGRFPPVLVCLPDPRLRTRRAVDLFLIDILGRMSRLPIVDVIDVLLGFGATSTGGPDPSWFLDCIIRNWRKILQFMDSILFSNSQVLVSNMLSDAVVLAGSPPTAPLSNGAHISHSISLVPISANRPATTAGLPISEPSPAHPVRPTVFPDTYHS